MESRRSLFGIHADWQAIALCLVAASTFWFFNAMNDDHTADVSYPIEFIYDEEDVIPVEGLPEKVRFNASGFGWNLLRKTLKINRPPIVVNLENLSSYRYMTANELLPVIKGQLDDIKVNYLLQDTIPLRFEKVKEKKFQLQIDSTTVSLVPGYKIVTPVKMEPQSITIKGPASMINSLKDSFFIKLPEKDIDSDYEEEIKLEFDLPELLKVEPEEVEVQFGVAQFVQENITIYPKLRNFPKDSSIIPAQDDLILTVLVKPEDLEKLKDEEFHVILNLNKLNTADSTLTPKFINVPEYIREYFFTPSAVKVKQLK